MELLPTYNIANRLVDLDDLSGALACFVIEIGPPVKFVRYNTPSTTWYRSVQSGSPLPRAVPAPGHFARV